MSVTAPADRPDPHQELADKLGITRAEAKITNIGLAYHTQQLGRDRGTAFSILRCHEIARLWFQPWGAAKGEMWKWLTQDQPFDEMVAIQTIRKFLPDPKDLNQNHPLLEPLRLKDRLTMARGIAAKATSEAQLVKIEELLRPFAYILEREGHKVYQ